jgi:hypothetical protein
MALLEEGYSSKRKSPVTGDFSHDFESRDSFGSLDIFQQIVLENVLYKYNLQGEFGRDLIHEE